MLAALLLAPLVITGYQAPCTKPPSKARVQLDLVDLELGDAVRLAACVMGANLMLKQAPKGAPISIYGPTPVRVKEATEALLAAIDARGYTLTRRGAYLMLHKSADAPRQPTPIRGSLPKRSPRRDTRLVQLRHVDAKEIPELIRGLATKEAQIQVHEKSNLLIITERADNLRRLARFLEHIDQEGVRPDIRIYEVFHADAAELGRQLQTLYEQRIQKVVVDERSNRLIVIAAPRAQAEAARLLAMLDIGRGGSGDRVRVHFLGHASAENMSRVFEAMKPASQRPSRGRNSSRKKKRSLKSKTRRRAPSSQPF